MKIIKLFVLVLISAGMFAGCGKPKDPESIEPETEPDGGYKIVAKLTTSGNAQDVIKNGNYLYMALGEGGLLIVDVTDPENPEVVKQITENVRGYSSKIAFKDSIVYLAAGTYGITVVDVTDPLQAGVNGWYVNIVTPAKNLFTMGEYLFTAISEKGIQILNIKKNLSLPDARANITTIGYANGVITSADDSTLFIACGEMGLSIFDMSHWQDGYGLYPQTGWCDTPGYAEDVALQEDGSIAYLACGTEGVHAVSYADTADIHLAGSFITNGYAKELRYEDRKIFVTTGLRGVQVIDVSNVSGPEILGVIATANARGFDMDEKYLYVADEAEGLVIISRPD
jgi:hypothetical protein